MGLDLAVCHIGCLGRIAPREVQETSGHQPSGLPYQRHHPVGRVPCHPHLPAVRIIVGTGHYCTLRKHLLDLSPKIMEELLEDFIRIITARGCLYLTDCLGGDVGAYSLREAYGLRALLLVKPWRITCIYVAPFVDG